MSGGWGWSEAAMREFANWCRTDTMYCKQTGQTTFPKMFSFLHFRKIGVSPSVPTLQRYLNLCIPRKGVGFPQSQFPHLCVCEWSIYSHILPTSFPAAEYADRSEEYINRSQKHECRNCDCSRAIPFLGIFISDFLYCVFTPYSLKSKVIIAQQAQLNLRLSCGSVRGLLRSNIEKVGLNYSNVPIMFLYLWPMNERKLSSYQ